MTDFNLSWAKKASGHTRTQLHAHEFDHPVVMVFILTSPPTQTSFFTSPPIGIKIIINILFYVACFQVPTKYPAWILKIQYECSLHLILYYSTFARGSWAIPRRMSKSPQSSRTI